MPNVMASRRKCSVRPFPFLPTLQKAQRAGTKELLHFPSIASGSLSELDTLLEAAKQLEYITEAKVIQTKIDDVSGLVMGLRASLLKKV